MKTNRMLDIMILLLEGSELSAQELAEKFNVTEKTIYRDIDFIREAGIPIIGKRGAKGGFRADNKDSLKNEKVTLKEQHKLMKLLKNQDRIPQEQLNEIMNSIEDLFKDNTVNWIETEFNNSKLNKLFVEIKEAIINQQLIRLKFETKDSDLEISRVKPHKIYIRDGGIYLKFQNIDENKQEEVLLESIKDIINEPTL